MNLRMLLLGLVLALCAGRAPAQVTLIPGVTYGANTSGSPATLVVCPANVASNSGCGVQLTGTSDQVPLNAAIAACGNANMSAAWSGSITGTTLTVTSVTSGALSQYMVIAGAGITANTFYISSPGVLGGAGTYTLSSSPGTITSETMTGYNPGLGNGCNIQLRAGVISISSPIIIDRSFVSLSGESQPMWGAFLQSWNNSPATPTGLPCAAGTTIQVSGAIDAIQLNNTTVPDNTEQRHRGIHISNLCLLGPGGFSSSAYTNTGINTAVVGSSVGIDWSTIDHMFIQRFAQAIDVTWDSGSIDTISAQDNGGAGGGIVQMQGVNVRLSNSLLYDNGGNAVELDGRDMIVSNNTIGHCFSDCIFAKGIGASIVGNGFPATFQSVLFLQAANIIFTGNTIDYSAGGSIARTVPAIRGSGTGTLLAVANIFRPNGTEPAGVYAMDFTGFNSGGASENIIQGGWNNNSPITIHNTASFNNIHNNVGDSLTGVTTPTISSGFGTTPTIASSAGPISFSINVGTGGTATSGVIGLPTAIHGWSCSPSDGGATPTGQTEVSLSTTNAVTITNYSRTVGTPVAWTASEILQVTCTAN